MTSALREDGGMKEGREGEGERGRVRGKDSVAHSGEDSPIAEYRSLIHSMSTFHPHLTPPLLLTDRLR